MKKLSSTMVAAAASAGMLIGVGAATAQIPDPAPSECPAGQHFENVDGTFQCVDDSANPDPGGSSNDGIPPGVEDTQTCPDGSPRDMSKIDPATGAYGACGTSDDSGPTPEPDEDAPENDGIPPGVDDTATCPDGSPRDMSKIDPATGVYGYCPTSDDETPGDDENPGDDTPGDDENPGDEQPGEDENPGEENPGDKPDTPKNDGKQTGTKNTGLAVTGVQATALGGAALALLVGGVAATRLARKNSKDS
ncbi:intestinal mucin [Corynebacterium sp. LK26]|uniref:intestinal mucin n=1 Tax=Corynebacterium sp. LK26 TaxID=2044581 RepID=UPI001652A9AE|nr:intestinal mucin [Corynebacterium sp. LK26]MBC6792356.1 intestinal mucin [Corynebacterium sp. LK26]